MRKIKRKRRRVKDEFDVRRRVTDKSFMSARWTVKKDVTNATIGLRYM